MTRQTSELWRSVLGGVAGWAALAVACWVTFGGAVDAPFFMDDTTAVVGNETLESLSASLKPPGDTGVAGRPVVNFTFAMNRQWGGGAPGSYRVFNIFLHSFSAALVFLILSRTLKLREGVSAWGRPTVGNRGLRVGALAFAASLVWAVHPLQTEAVMYITQRTELMVGLFYLATLYAAMRYWETRGHFVPPAKRVWLVLATIFCCAGMACKEVMVTAPVVVLLYERTFVKSSLRDILRGSWRLYVGLALGWVVLATLNFHGPRSLSAGFGLSVSATTWWLTQTQVLWMYLSKVFWPHPLVIHYELPYVWSLTAAWPWVAATAALVTATAALLWRRYAVGFVGAWVLLILSPTLVVPIPTEVAAERRMYLPLAGIAAVVIVGVYLMWGKMARKAAVAGTCVTAVVVAIALGMVSAERLKVYRDEIALWGDTVAKQPGNVSARVNLGLAMSSAGDRAGAKQQYEEVLRMRPDNAKAHNGLGLILAEEGRSSEAMEHYHRAIELNPSNPNPYNNLGIELGKAGRLGEAIEQFQQAIKLDGDMINAHVNMAHALRLSGQRGEAIRYYRSAAELARQQGDYDEARTLEEWAGRLSGGR